MGCSWIPNLEIYNGGDWHEYQDKIYHIYSTDFLKSFPIYNGKKVQIRKHPMYNNKEEGFFHITGKGENREPDFRRCERIRYPRAFIESCSCENMCQCDYMIWKENHKNKGKYRYYFYKEKERYVVILEERKNYYLLITAYYLHYSNAIKDKKKQYLKAQTENATIR